ncbi:hypothetical protein OE88DRAFT_1655504, partial [Heliocybe sulcata]
MEYLRGYLCEASSPLQRNPRNYPEERLPSQDNITCSTWQYVQKRLRPHATVR